MKKVLMIALLMVGFAAMAQKGERGDKNGHEAMKDWTPEQITTLKTKKMTLALDLTEAQQVKIGALELENAKMRKAKMEERKALKESGEVKKPSSEERYAMANAKLDRQIAQKAEMKSILSDEQYSKWGKMQHRKGKHRKGKRGKSKDSHGEKK